MQKELEEKINKLKLEQKADKENQEKDQIAFDNISEKTEELLKRKRLTKEKEPEKNAESKKLTIDKQIEAAKKRVFDDINKSADEEIIKSKQEQLEADKETLKRTETELVELKQERSARKLETKENVNIVDKLQTIGLEEEDFKEIPEWKKLSDGEKLLAIEQISQDALSKIKEIGERRFQEQNKISFSRKKFNPLKFGKKILKNISKAVWISKEEKQALRDLEEGKIKPNSETIKQVVERAADMNLDVVEKDGKAFIEFIKVDKNLSETEQKIIEEYNKAANEYAKVPDSWKNKKAANSKDGNFLKNKNYENYKNTEAVYKKASFDLLNSMKEQYLKTGLSEKEAELKAMLDLKDDDFQISALQFLNTNPDVNQELKNIRNKSSWGRLFDNENIWRLAYMGTGWAARTATVSTLGFIAAPLVSGAIGGARARRKAGQKINTAFLEGRTTETFTERKQANKKGLFTDKNENKSLFSKTLSGKDINAKEVGAFIDADSQIQRLNSLIQKISEAKTQEEKILLKDQLNARVGYIEEKNASGLINYGTKNALNLNYELFKNLSFAQAQISLAEFLDETQQEKNDRRYSLLGKIMLDNEAKFDKKQANFKNKEMIRGAAVAAGFSIFGHELRAGLTEATEKIKEVISAGTIGETIRHKPEDILSGHEKQQPIKIDHNKTPTKIPVNTEKPAVPQEGETPKPIQAQTETTEDIKHKAPVQVNPEGAEENTNVAPVQVTPEGAEENTESSSPIQTNSEESQAPIENIGENPQATIPPKLENSSLEGNETPATEGQTEGREIPETHQNETTVKIKNENNSGTYTEEEYKLKTEGQAQQENVKAPEQTNTYTEEEYKVKNGEQPKISTEQQMPTEKTGVAQTQTEQTGTTQAAEPEKPETDMTPAETQTQQAGAPYEHKLDATGHPVEKFITEGENPYELSNKQMTEINDLYTEKMNKMFPEEKMWNWERIQNYKGMAHSILNLEKVTDEYSPLKKLLQEIHDKTGLKPIENTGLDSGTSPREYIMKGLQYARKNNIKIKF